MGAQSTFVRFTFGSISAPTQLEHPSTLRGGSLLEVLLTERKLYHVMQQVRAKVSVSFDDCQQLLSSLPGGVGGRYNLEAILWCAEVQLRRAQD
jgi:hypothetical protein